MSWGRHPSLVCVYQPSLWHHKCKKHGLLQKRGSDMLELLLDKQLGNLHQQSSSHKRAALTFQKCLSKEEWRNACIDVCGCVISMQYLSTGKMRSAGRQGKIYSKGMMVLSILTPSLSLRWPSCSFSIAFSSGWKCKKLKHLLSGFPGLAYE